MRPQCLSRRDAGAMISAGVVSKDGADIEGGNIGYEGIAELPAAIAAQYSPNRLSVVEWETVRMAAYLPMWASASPVGG